MFFTSLQNYYSLIDKPMDLNHISCSLSQGKYLTPLMFAGDVRLIFSNSKVFNTNKRSKVYTGSSYYYLIMVDY